MSKLKALHIGINKYPQGNALACCVADAQAMKKIFAGSLLTDKDAPDTKIRTALTTIHAPRRNGAIAVVSYSGHGTQVRDTNGDEPDGYDEAIVGVNLRVVTDDQVYAILRKNTVDPLLLISDSCFSGTMQRAAVNLTPSHISHLHRLDTFPRYLPSSLVRGKAQATNAGPQAPLENVILIAGCTDFEYSYEGNGHGALTLAFTQVYKHGMTPLDLYTEIKAVFARGEYATKQHPQMSCPDALLNVPLP